MKRYKFLILILAIFCFLPCVSAADTEDLIYSCVYKSVDRNGNNVDTHWVYFYEDKDKDKYKDKYKAIYKNPSGVEFKINNWMDDKHKESNLKHLKGKTCYKYLYRAGSDTFIYNSGPFKKKYGLTNDVKTLETAPEAYELVEAATKKQNNSEFVKNNKNKNFTVALECAYNKSLKDNKKEEIIINYNSVGEAISVTHPQFCIDNIKGLICYKKNSYKISYNLSESETKILNKKSCLDPLFICYVDGIGKIYKNKPDSINENKCSEIKNTDKVSEEALDNNKTTNEENGNPISDDVTTPEETESVTNDPLYTNMLSEINTEVAAYNADCNCKKKKCSEYLNVINKKKEDLKKYCNAVITTHDYDDSILQSCLNFEKGIDKITCGEEETVACGLSSDMIDFLKNIIKLVRYFIPVLVIILGLFDFMRAAASGSEDHMKKAQKQLVIRIVAAGLVFLVPLVIGFFLEQFGFVAKDCNILF